MPSTDSSHPTPVSSPLSHYDRAIGLSRREREHHRATGRTLPHCYIEVKDEPSAVLLLDEHDRSSLGDRTVRVKMERIGELMRDVRSPFLPSSLSQNRAEEGEFAQLFDQSKYFVHAPHLFNAASAPLPQLPQDGYALPSDRPILGESDIQALSSWLGPPVRLFSRNTSIDSISS